MASCLKSLNFILHLECGLLIVGKTFELTYNTINLYFETLMVCIVRFVSCFNQSTSALNSQDLLDPDLETGRFITQRLRAQLKKFCATPCEPNFYLLEHMQA